MRPVAATARAFNSAAAWSTASAAVGQLIRFGLFVALSRLVSPTEFGVVALAAILIELLGSVSDGGVNEAIIRRPSLSTADSSTAFWMMLALGGLSAVLALGLAPLASTVFNSPTVAPVVVLMASTLLIAPLGAVHLAHVTRALGFRKLALWNLATNVVAGAVGIWLAFRGFGVWALAARSVISTSGLVLLAWIGSPWKPRPVFDLQAAREFVAFGGQLLGSRVLGQVNARGVELIAGLLIAPAAVGFLRVGGQCLNLLTQLTIAPLSQIGMPLLARSLDEPGQYADAIARLARLSALVIYPVFFGAMAVSSLAFPLIFGAHWSLSGIVMPILCALAVPLQVNLLINAVLVAQGKGSLLLRWSLLQAAIGLPLALIGGLYGLFPLVALTVLRSYIMLPVGLLWLKRHAGTAFLQLLLPSLKPFTAAIVMAGVVLGAKLQLQGLFDPAVMLGLLVLLGALVYGAIVLLWERELWRDRLASA